MLNFCQRDIARYAVSEVLRARKASIYANGNAVGLTSVKGRNGPRSNSRKAKHGALDTISGYTDPYAAGLFLIYS